MVFKQNQRFFFQHENIDKVVFRGYSDEEEDRFMDIYSKWEEDLKIPRKEVK